MYTLSFYNNVVFPAQAEYSYFSADLRLKIFLYYSCIIAYANANMADHSVGARDESNESETSQALMFCVENAFPEKSCFVVDLVPLFCPPYAFWCS